MPVFDLEQPRDVAAKHQRPLALRRGHALEGHRLDQRMFNRRIGGEQQPVRANQSSERIEIDRRGGIQRRLDADIRVAKDECQRWNSRVNDEGLSGTILD
jgi:hypothetical protein